MFARQRQPGQILHDDKDSEREKRRFAGERRKRVCGFSPFFTPFKNCTRFLSWFNGPRSADGGVLVGAFIPGVPFSRESDLVSDLPELVPFGASVAFSCLVREFKGSWYFSQLRL